jgi:hypothetical protein
MTEKTRATGLFVTKPYISPTAPEIDARNRSARLLTLCSHAGHKANADGTAVCKFFESSTHKINKCMHYRDFDGLGMCTSNEKI